MNRVVGLEKLRTKHKTFEAKRALLKEGELFLVDDRIVSEVGKGLGKMWREAKKCVSCLPGVWAEADEWAQATYPGLPRSQGAESRARARHLLDLPPNQHRNLPVRLSFLTAPTLPNLPSCSTIKFGTTTLHTPTELLANLLALIPQLAIRLPNSGWSNLASLHLKTSTSIALPIFNASLDDAGIFAGQSEEELKAIEKRKEVKEVLRKEREAVVAEKEKRRVERSATREGKGREEKKERKRKTSEDVVVEVGISGPIVDEEAPKVKKVKKSKA